MYMSTQVVGLAFLALADAHCKITYATGDFGGAGVALGLGLNNHTSQSDVTTFLDPDLPLGSTAANGPIDPAVALPRAEKLSGSWLLPQISAGSTVSMTMHQIDPDGAGPMHCMIDSSAIGDEFTPMRVTVDVPGMDGMSAATDQDFPLEVVVPSGIECEGRINGHLRVCLVKCVNRRGYGGSLVVQQISEVADVKLELRDAALREPGRKEGKQGNKARKIVKSRGTDSKRSIVEESAKPRREAGEQDQRRR
ncbi:MAG: hypothetical protein MMC23_007292 [Stictis urceolatum]|nr:hypothetical protein [Stictis urceolata]